MLIRTRVFIFLLLFVLYSYAFSFSEEEGVYRQRLGELITYEKPQEDLPHEWDSYVRYMPSTGAKGLSGSVGIVQAASEYSYDLKLGGKLPLQLGVATKYTGINNGTEVKLPSNLTFAAFGMEVTLPLFQLNDNYFRINLEPSFFGSKWNFRSSNFRLLSQYFIISRPTEELTLLLGVAVFPDFEDQVCPIVGFIYQPNDKLQFNIIPKNPNITYSLNEKIDLFLEADMSLGEYEVDKDNVKNTVLRYKEIMAGFGLQYNINKNVQALFSAGGVFDRSLKYRDSLGKVGIKDGAYLNCQVQIRI